MTGREEARVRSPAGRVTGDGGNRGAREVHHLRRSDEAEDYDSSSGRDACRLHRRERLGC